MRLRKTGLLGLAVLLAGGFSWFERLVAPDAELVDPHWSQSDPQSTRSVDHAAWTAFLERHVVPDAAGVHRVDYAGVAAEDRAALRAYLEALQAVPVSGLARDEQLAYWINLYNAKTVAIVLDDYPVDSIRDIKFGSTLALGPWGKKVVEVEGRPLSLNDIEHGIVRPVFAEPRIHYALNCAAIGCPNLARSAYAAADLDAMLEAGARAYVNDPRGVRFAGDELTASSIYNWFRPDFGGSEGAVLDHLRRYAEPDLAARLAGRRTIDAYQYDWALNDANAVPAN